MSSGPGDRQQDRNAEFLGEAGEIVDRIQAGVANIVESHRGGTVSPTQLNDLFRSAHSLKGLAGIFGVETLVGLSHEFEDLLHGMRLGKVPIEPSLLAVLEEAADTFGRVLASLRSGAGAKVGGLEQLARKLQQAAQGSVPVVLDPLAELELPDGLRAVLTEYEEHRLSENARSRTPLYVVRAVLTLDAFDRQLAALSEQLGALGELLSTLPGSDAPAGHIEFKLLFATGQPVSSWEPALREIGGEIHVLPVGRRSARKEKHESAEPAAEAEDAKPGSVIGESIRVDLRKLDSLMSVVGELALVRAEVARALAKLRTIEGTNLVSLELQKTARTFERHLTELQQGIMNVRMVPLRLVFERLSRTARRIAREMGKDVRIQVTGEDTELDKVLIEELTDPLMHLVRNAIDHGIEASELREELGKTAQGHVTIRAYPKGRHVVIEVNDDGAGLDPVMLRRTALESGFVDEERVGGLSVNELYSLIFRPGFSTRREVTEVSGRGVGMDVVKTNISRLSGVIDVSSTVGVGTTFTITLPITLAIVQALLVQVGKQKFALPLSSVLELRTLEPWEIRTIEGREVIFGRDETIPLLWLSEVFGIQQSTQADELRHVILVGLAQTRVGLVVDELHGQQDIIIKPLGRILRRVAGIAGATDLGADGLVLVIDVAELATSASGSLRAATG